MFACVMSFLHDLIAQNTCLGAQHGIDFYLVLGTVGAFVYAHDHHRSNPGKFDDCMQRRI